MKSKKSERIYIRLTPEEKAKLQKLADKHERGSLSAYIIKKALYEKNNN